MALYHGNDDCRGAYDDDDECCACPKCPATVHEAGCYFLREQEQEQGQKQEAAELSSEVTYHNREFCRGFNAEEPESGRCCGCPDCPANAHQLGCHHMLEQGSMPTEDELAARVRKLVDAFRGQGFSELDSITLASAVLQSGRITGG